VPGKFFDRTSWVCSRTKQNIEITVEERGHSQEGKIVVEKFAHSQEASLVGRIK